MSIETGHWIAGELSREGNESFHAIDPSTGDSLEGAFCEATPVEIDRAVRSAEEAARALRHASPMVRADLLDRIADGIEALGDELLERSHLETALPLPRLTMERGRTCGQLRAFATELRDGDRFAPLHIPADPAREPLPRPDLTRRALPIGPVAVFGASNFPLAFSVAGGATASALAAGCPVIVKGHPLHPGTSALVAGAIVEAIAALSLPTGVFSLLHGRHHEVGAALVDHPSLRAVAFTGSCAGGTALFRRAGERTIPIPVFAEMGSVNPVFVLPSALADRHREIADLLAGSVLLGVGQFCTNPGLIAWIDGEGSDLLLAGIAARMLDGPAGVMLGTEIRDHYESGVTRRGAIAGVEEMARGPRGGEACSVGGVLHRVDALTLLSEPALTEELFGPATLAVIARDAEELLEIARVLPGQLTATIQAEPRDVTLREALRPILEERCGRLLLGGAPTGVEVSPAMQHGGPWPATTDARFTSVGLAAIERFLRPVCYQGWEE